MLRKEDGGELSVRLKFLDAADRESVQQKLAARAPAEAKEVKVCNDLKYQLSGAERSGMPFWSYELNSDKESSKENGLRHVKMVAAMRMDMGID